MPVDVSTAPGAFRSLTGRSHSLLPTGCCCFWCLYQLQNSLSIGPECGSAIVQKLPGGCRKIHALGFERHMPWGTFYAHAETRISLCLLLLTLLFYYVLNSNFIIWRRIQTHNEVKNETGLTSSNTEIGCIEWGIWFHNTGPHTTTIALVAIPLFVMRADERYRNIWWNFPDINFISD
jgi:hypothetical protein